MVKCVNYMYLFKKSYSLLRDIVQTNKVYSNDHQGRVYQNCEFYNPMSGVIVLGRGHVGHVLIMHCFFKTLLLFNPGIKQTYI